MSGGWWPNVSNKLRCRSKPGRYNNKKSSYNAMTFLFYFFGEDRDLMMRVLGVNRNKINYWINRGYIPVYDAMDIQRAVPDYPKTLEKMCPYVCAEDWPEYQARYQYHLDVLLLGQARADKNWYGSQ